MQWLRSRIARFPRQALVLGKTLFLAGAFIAAKSGVERVSSGRDVLQIAGNFSAMLLRVAGYVVILLLVQHFIGLRSTFGW